jgi:hypothetical protein
MDLKALIRAAKSSVKTGEWKQGEIPRAQWPSRRAKSKFYKWGPLYKWRIVTFSALGRECRVLILLNENKQIFRASFGVTDKGDTTVLCDYEFHASEPGWHCHARCDDIATIDAGTNRFGSDRLPKYNSPHRRTEFKFGKSDLSVVSAFNCAVTVFGIDKGDGAL